MRWLRFPSRNRGWRAYTFGKSGGPHRPMPPAPPRPRELIEVLGVGKTETVSGVALTLLSLERYREGDVVTFRLARQRAKWQRDFPSPELFLAVGPAGAPATPRFSGMSGGGGGGMEEIEYRYTFSFSPGMPDDANDWVIEVTKIHWIRPYRSPERNIESVDLGPWRFAIRP